MWQVQFLLVCCFRFSKQGLTMELGLAWNSALRKLWLKAQAPSRQLMLGLKALKAHTLSQRQLVLGLKVQASPRPTLALWLLTSNPISICRKHAETTKGAKEQKCHALWVSRGERKETEKELMLQAMTSYQELQQTCTHPCIVAMSVWHDEHGEQRLASRHSTLPGLQEAPNECPSPAP